VKNQLEGMNLKAAAEQAIADWHHAFINEYGYEDESFFAALERMFSRAVILLKTQDASTQDGLRPCCQRIVDEVCGMGWGHHDELLRCWTEASSKS